MGGGPSQRRCLVVFEPPDGGVAEHVRQLCAGLREHGWEPSVAGPLAASAYPALRAAGIPIAKLPLRPGYGHPRDDARALAGLARLLRGERFDLVHLHSAKAGVLGRLTAPRPGPPVVYSPHCFPFVGELPAARRAVSLAIERGLAPRADAIVCVAEEERELARRHRLGARLELVRNGSPSQNGAVAPDPELARLAAEGPLAGCIAVLRRQKTVHVFVEAAAVVLERMPEARLAVIGNGPLLPSLRALAARLGIDRRLHFLPFAAPASRYLRALDVFVLPSAWEGLPLSVLEAMACGVPQVATDVGGTGEAVRHGVTGLLVPPNDPAALGAAVCELLSDPARRAAMGRASRARHEAEFTVERMVAETAATYDRLVPRQPAHAPEERISLAPAGVNRQGVGGPAMAAVDTCPPVGGRVEH